MSRQIVVTVSDECADHIERSLASGRAISLWVDFRVSWKIHGFHMDKPHQFDCSQSWGEAVRWHFNAE